MAGRYDSNPFEEEEVNPFADGGGRGKASKQSTYTGSVPPVTNSRLSPLPPEPADFYNPTAPVDIPLDSASVDAIFSELFNLHLHTFSFSCHSFT
ncbi:UNVERIFIED_CONTAM: Secretory carrier-associated membrane protein 1 [Sesamum angustifolium]|uniref:Secretory carrier-associated membrane protein 1 n=1 Tax=Sesamum angustifolium TaxID=2727405 RepID=A0AAW2PCX9_9LAMI